MSETDKDTQPQHEEQEQEQQAEATTAPPAEEVATGGRQRRSTQKFGFSEAKEEEEEEFKPPVGPGAKLRDMEAVAERISHMGKKDAETIKSLYNIMYGRRFQQKNIRLIKDHILDFTGIPDADDKTRQQLVGKIGRWMRSYVQDVMDILGVDRSKKSFDEEGKAHDKEGLINRLIDWLIEPQDSKNAKKSAAKKKTAAAKPAATKSTKAAKETTGKKRKSAATAKKPAKKAKTSAKKSAAPVEEDDEEDATESEVDKEEDEDEANDSDSDFDEEEDGKAKKKTQKKKTPTKRAPRNSKKSAAAAEASEASDAEDEAKAEAMDDAMDDAKNDAKVATKADEKKSHVPKILEAVLSEDKPAETKPLDAEVQKKVEEIIAKGDASQLTVKKIVRQLSEDLGQDFTPQKAAIKDFVTNLQM